MTPSAQTPAPPSGGPTSVDRVPDIHTFEHHWQDEADAAYLYGVLAGIEKDPHKSDVFRRLSAVETRHLEIWRA